MFEGIDIDAHKGGVAGAYTNSNTSKVNVDAEALKKNIQQKKEEKKRKAAAKKKEKDELKALEDLLKEEKNESVEEMINSENIDEEDEEVESAVRAVDNKILLEKRNLINTTKKELRAIIPVNLRDVKSSSEITEENISSIEIYLVQLKTLISDLSEEYPDYYAANKSNYEKMYNSQAKFLDSVVTVRDRLLRNEEAERKNAENAQRIKDELAKMKREREEAIAKAKKEKCKAAKAVIKDLATMITKFNEETAVYQEISEQLDFYRNSERAFKENAGECGDDAAKFIRHFENAMKKTEAFLVRIKTRDDAKTAAEAKELAKRKKEQEELDRQLAAMSEENIKGALEYANKIRVVISKIGSAEKVKKINPAFYNLVNRGEKLNGEKRLAFYYRTEKEIKNFLKTLGSSPSDVKAAMLILKQDYEVLRGPVRVYVKAKPKTSKENNTLLVKKSGEYDVKFEGNKVGPFSRVYDDVTTANQIFKDSIKETIDGMVGNADHVIMAYGPSGSGKTYNLIGEKKTKGVISYCIKDLLKTCDIEMSSYQLYNACKAGMTTSVKFDSFKYNCDFDKEKAKIVRSAKDGSVYEPKPLHPYKYRQGNEFSIGDAEIKEIAQICFGVSTMTEVNHATYTGKVPKFDGKRIVAGGKIVLEPFKSVKPKASLKGSGKIDTLRNAIHNMFAALSDTRGVAVSPSVNLYGNDDSMIKVIKGGGFGAGSGAKIEPGRFISENVEITHVVKMFTTITPSASNLVMVDGKTHTLHTYSNRKLSTAASDAKLIIGILLNKFVNFSNLFDTKFDFVPSSSDRDFTRTSITSPEQFERYYALANASRPSRGTPLNPDSSRSHLFFEFFLTPKDDGIQTKLTFVDLAGNEKADENLFLMRAEGDGVVGSLAAVRDILEQKQTGKPISEDIRNVDDSIFSNVVSTNKKNCVNTSKLAFQHIRDTFAEPNTTVSMILNLPGYGFDKADSNQNRKDAIEGGLEMVEVLMKKNVISKYID